jgi:hypothetical protein
MKRPVVIRRGTAAELAQHDSGYVGNGESQYTRRAAHPDVKPRGHVQKTAGHHSRPRLIAENEGQLRWLQNEARMETNPTRLAKLQKRVGIKRAFIDRLKKERGPDDRDKIETIFGETDTEWF